LPAIGDRRRAFAGHSGTGPDQLQYLGPEPVGEGGVPAALRVGDHLPFEVCQSLEPTVVVLYIGYDAILVEDGISARMQRRGENVTASAPRVALG